MDPSATSTMKVGRTAGNAPTSAQEDCDNKKTTVLILYTGGTMGMKHDEAGALVPVPGYFTDQIMHMEEIQSEQMPLYTIKDSCMGPREWVKIAEDIEQNYYIYDGFVVIMGTDTMAYAASAMSFMLENLGKTVVFTGSQIPFAEVYNDARRNLIVSIIFASLQEFPEVCIFFNDRLLRGNRCSKVNSVGLGAFDSPNFPPLATLSVNINERKDLALPPPKGPFRVRKKLDANILVIRLVPGFDDAGIEAVIHHAPRVRAIVLEMYGTGNAPSHQDGLLRVVREATARGVLVVAVSQCVKGGVLLDKYEMGRKFSEAGVVAGADMTTEAVTTKLAFLLGRLDDVVSVGRLLTVNLRGELSPPEAIARKFYSKDYVSRL